MIQAIVVAFGLVMGSFLNVCIYRIPRGRSVIIPWSSCPQCKSPLRPWENIPVLSYILLRGKCANCGARIGWIYPLVEISTALAFYLLYSKYDFTSPFLTNVILFSLLIVLVFIDLFERILPDVITLGGLAAGFLLSPLQSREFFAGDPLLGEATQLWSKYVHSLVGAILGAGILWVVAIAYLKLKKVEGMGFGDIKMMAMVGAFLGWRYAWLTVFFGSLLGAVVGSLYIYFARQGSRYELPFGSFLGVGAILAALWGVDLVSWYASKL